jgi:hypothetical protein
MFVHVGDLGFYSLCIGTAQSQGKVDGVASMFF